MSRKEVVLPLPVQFAILFIGVSAMISITIIGIMGMVGVNLSETSRGEVAVLGLSVGFMAGFWRVVRKSGT